jgi:hypothetical protein
VVSITAVKNMSVHLDTLREYSAPSMVVKHLAVGKHTFTGYRNIWLKGEGVLKQMLIQQKEEPTNVGLQVEAIEVAEGIQNAILKPPQYALGVVTDNQLMQMDADISAMYLGTMHHVSQETKGIFNDAGDTLENDPHLAPCPKAVVQNHEDLGDLNHLSVSQCKVVGNLLKEFDHVIFANPNDYSIIKTHIVSPDIEGGSPFYYRPFPMSKLLIDILKRHLTFFTSKGGLVSDTNNLDCTTFYSNAHFWCHGMPSSN